MSEASDDVLRRVLAGLRDTGPEGILLPRHASVTAPLPRRIPGDNPMRLPAWAGQWAPMPVTRDAASIAANAHYYFRGYRAGAAVAVQRLDPGVAVLPTPIAAATAGSTRRSSRARTRRAAMRLVDVVLRVIPEVERPRYGEEFRAELAELRGLHQLAYAARLLIAAPALRRSLSGDPLRENGGRRWPFRD
ncbi:hypothetical protein GCM10029963_05710 [Micromonospora andamanensis]|uniref:hypothetical protein n=1 Tax=Micromonospora andamanensis TaxID=1287068 RepID=UPI0019521136|nr:hypothetical protein [Micromonospora andamanensis]GIJ38429.1 hypothetical protein Vwe01_17540 [Micromonospora andamanensis]